jgi:hypothetical protein
MAESAITILGLPSGIWLAALSGLFGVAFLLGRIFTVKLEPLEPPILAPKIPIVGHILGLMMYQNEVFEKIEEKSTPPAYTMPMMRDKMYIVKSPELIQAMYRNANLTMDRQFDGALRSISGISQERTSLVTSAETREAFMRSFTPLMAQDNLSAMNKEALKTASRELARLPRDDVVRIDNLHKWLRDFLVVMTSVALLGSKSPFIGNYALIEAFWSVESATLSVLANPVTNGLTGPLRTVPTYTTAGTPVS